MESLCDVLWGDLAVDGFERFSSWPVPRVLTLLRRVLGLVVVVRWTSFFPRRRRCRDFTLPEDGVPGLRLPGCARGYLGRSEDGPAVLQVLADAASLLRSCLAIAW